MQVVSSSVEANPYSPADDSSLVMHAVQLVKLREKKETAITPKAKAEIDIQLQALEAGRKQRVIDEDNFLVRLKKTANNNSIVHRMKKEAKGSFSMVPIANSKNHTFTLVIRNSYDVYAFGRIMFTDTAPERYPAGYEKVAAFFLGLRRKKESVSENFIKQFANVVARWLPKIDKDNKVVNPITKRKVEVGKKVFNNVFASIKLRAFHEKKLHKYKTKNYDVNEYCVPSYFSKVLPKKKYALIKEELETIKTPTYVELTEMLNSIDIGLTVYSVVHEHILQDQTDYSKKYTIIIHEQHMYVTPNIKNLLAPFTVEYVDEETMEKLKEANKLAVYDDSVIVDSIKYTPEDKYATVSKAYDFMGTFSHHNIDFYRNCDIRAARYSDNYVDEREFEEECEFEEDSKKKKKRKWDGIYRGVDINKCYLKILNNHKGRVFPIQRGDEKITKFSGKIQRHGFYFCEFIGDMIEIQKALYAKKQWIYGDVLNKLKKKLNIKILYEEVTVEFKTGIDNDYMTQKPNESNADFEKRLNILRQYTGVLEKYKSSDTDHYDTKCELEVAGLLEHFGVDGYATKTGVSAMYDRYKTRSGIYTKLAIYDYSKYEVYVVYDAMIEVLGPFTIRRIYTDSILTYIPITEKDKFEINKRLDGISVKLQNGSTSIFEAQPAENTLIPVKRDLTNYVEADIVQLLTDKKSFCLTGRGGYGKTTITLETILPYFKKNNIKHVLYSTTIDNALEIGGVHIQSIFFTEKTSLNKLREMFTDIKYLLLDECSQMTMKMINTIQYLKNECDVRVILIGDINQCKSVESNHSYMKSPAFYNLIDYNMLTLVWKEGRRYSKEYDAFLTKILLAVGSSELVQLVLDYFSKQLIKEKNDKNEIFMVYTNDKGIELMNKKCLTGYTTVHRYQGKSIDKPHSIYEIGKLCNVPDVLYTALSRTTNGEYISIIIEDTLEDDIESITKDL